MTEFADRDLTDEEYRVLTMDPTEAHREWMRKRGIQTDKEGRRVNIYDYVAASTVDTGDQILYSNDPIEVKWVSDDGDAILVKGYSHLTGDSVTYILNPDTEVGLWTA